MILVPIHEFNPCHDTASGRFAGKGAGDCKGGSTPDVELAEHHAVVVEWTKKSGREAGLFINPQGQREAFHEEPDVERWYRATDQQGAVYRLKAQREGVALGTKEMLAVPDPWMSKAGTLIHTHPSGSPFSVPDLMMLGDMKGDRIVVFGQNGEWYEATKTSASTITADSIEKLQATIEADRQAWVYESTVALFKHAGFTVEPWKGAIPQFIAKKGGKTYSISRLNSPMVAIDNLYDGDGGAARTAAMKISDWNGFVHTRLRTWADQHKVGYRSWLDARTS